jgi:hypothetical protein
MPTTYYNDIKFHNSATVSRETLLSNTELRENIVQNIIGGGDAEKFIESRDSDAQVRGQSISGRPTVQLLLSNLKRRTNAPKSIVVTAACYNDFFRNDGGPDEPGVYSLKKKSYSVAGKSGSEKMFIHRHAITSICKKITLV